MVIADGEIVGENTPMEVRLHPKDKLTLVIGVCTLFGMLFVGASYLFTTKQTHDADIVRLDAGVAERKAIDEKHEALEIATEVQLQRTLDKIDGSLREQSQAIQSLHTNQAILMRELGTGRPAPLPARMRRTP